MTGQKGALIKCDAACRALAAAVTVDEVKDVRNVAMAMSLYARQAKNKDLEADAFEIRVRAERRLGEMMAEQRDTVGFARNRAGPGRGKAGLPANPAFKPTCRCRH